MEFRKEGVEVRLVTAHYALNCNGMTTHRTSPIVYAPNKYLDGIYNTKYFMYI